jgi:hypothetical protein
MIDSAFELHLLSPALSSAAQSKIPGKSTLKMGRIGRMVAILFI